MKRQVKYSQRFVEKFREQGKRIHDNVYYLVEKLLNNEPIESARFSEYAKRKLYKYRLNEDVFVIYALEERGENETFLLVDLVSYKDTYGLMRSGK